MAIFVTFVAQQQNLLYNRYNKGDRSSRSEMTSKEKETNMAHPHVSFSNMPPHSITHSNNASADMTSAYKAGRGIVNTLHHNAPDRDVLCRDVTISIPAESDFFTTHHSELFVNLHNSDKKCIDSCMLAEDMCDIEFIDIEGSENSQRSVTLTFTSNMSDTTIQDVAHSITSSVALWLTSTAAVITVKHDCTTHARYIGADGAITVLRPDTQDINGEIEVSISLVSPTLTDVAGLISIAAIAALSRSQHRTITIALPLSTFYNGGTLADEADDCFFAHYAKHVISLAIAHHPQLWSDATYAHKEKMTFYSRTDGEAKPHAVELAYLSTRLDVHLPEVANVWLMDERPFVPADLDGEEKALLPKNPHSGLATTIVETFVDDCLFEEFCDFQSHESQIPLGDAFVFPENKSEGGIGFRKSMADSDVSGNRDTFFHSVVESAPVIHVTIDEEALQALFGSDVFVMEECIPAATYIAWYVMASHFAQLAKQHLDTMEKRCSSPGRVTPTLDVLLAVGAMMMRRWDRESDDNLFDAHVASFVADKIYLELHKAVEKAGGELTFHDPAAGLYSLEDAALIVCRYPIDNPGGNAPMIAGSTTLEKVASARIPQVYANVTISPENVHGSTRTWVEIAVDDSVFPATPTVIIADPLEQPYTSASLTTMVSAICEENSGDSSQQSHYEEFSAEMSSEKAYIAIPAAVDTFLRRIDFASETIIPQHNIGYDYEQALAAIDSDYNNRDTTHPLLLKNA